MNDPQYPPGNNLFGGPEPSSNPYASAAVPEVYPYAGGPPGYVIPAPTPDQLRRKLKAPGLALVIVGVIVFLMNLAFCGCFLVIAYYDSPGQRNDGEFATVMVVMAAIGFMFSLIGQGAVVLAGVQMMAARRRTLALVMTFIAMGFGILGILGCYHFFLQVPFCIWALVVLFDARVKYFMDNSDGDQLPVLS